VAAIEPQLLISAYCQGYFPMGMDNGETHWFLPESRGLLPLRDLHISRRFAQYLKTHPFEIRWDTAFGDVMRGCADREETWITNDILDSYQTLFDLGYGHSVEVWRAGKLVGGVYGVAIGGAFFGESMFSRETQASKVALVALQQRLAERGFLFHDTQWTTAHLRSLGGYEIPCDDYLKLLNRAIRMRVSFHDDKKTAPIPLRRASQL
jgi:leucyl/phenylalanyl-tRNA---protein transferase